MTSIALFSKSDDPQLFSKSLISSIPYLNCVSSTALFGWGLICTAFLIHALLIGFFIQAVNQPFPATKPGCPTPRSTSFFRHLITHLRKLVWPSAPGQATAGVKGQHDGKQHDLNLSEETSEEVFARGFHSTCCPMTSSTGTETHFILFKETFMFFS